MTTKLSHNGKEYSYSDNQMTVLRTICSALDLILKTENSSIQEVRQQLGEEAMIDILDEYASMYQKVEDVAVETNGMVPQLPAYVAGQLVKHEYLSLIKEKLENSLSL